MHHAMSPDVQHLLDSIRAPGLAYRDERARSGGPAPGDAPRPAPSSERLIVVTSPIRGAGRTAVAAGLADALATAGLAAVAVDLDPRDELGRRIAGARPPSTRTIAADAAASRAPACVPFGAAPAYLAALSLAPDAVVVDTPAGLSQDIEEVLAAADEVVVVLRPDAASCAAVATADAVLAHARLRAWRRFRARYVVNALDARRGPERAALAALRERLGARLWRRPLQWDPGVARGGPPRGPPSGPASQLAEELALLARDLMGGRAAVDRGGGAG
jgi:hypothetical protein